MELLKVKKQLVAVGFAGMPSLWPEFRNWIARGKKGKRPPLKLNDYELNVVEIIKDGDGYQITSHEDPGSIVIQTDVYADGSGSAIAYGAMAMGASAIEAVAAACERSVYCSGEIDAIDLG